MGNIDYSTLDDLPNDFLHLFQDTKLERLEGKPWTSFADSGNKEDGEGEPWSLVAH